MQPPGVVVGIDGSIESHRAVVWAAREAARRGEPLRIVHAWQARTYPANPFVTEWIPDLVDEPKHAAHDDVARAMDTAHSIDPSLEISIRTPGGPKSWTLLQATIGADLLVIGGKQKGVFGRLLFGSVTTHAVAHAPCPVVVVRDPLPGPDRPRGSAAHVVVGLDFSPESHQAAEFAFDYAAGNGLDVVAVQAWPPMDMPIASDGDPELKRAETAIARALTPVTDRFPGVAVTPLVARGSPLRVLLEAADRAELLVVGSRGLGTFGGMLLGSVSAALVHQAVGTVAVVRPLDRRPRVGGVPTEPSAS